MTFKPDSEQLASFTREGYVVVESLVEREQLPVLHKAFDDLFNGIFETGVSPDEVNWQAGKSDPTLSRQICNGWKANRDIARVVLNEEIASAIGRFAGWPGVRIMIDNVIWKAPGTQSLGYHQDNAFLSWFDPGEIVSCWIALDDTSAAGGTIEFAKASHQWALNQPEGKFHAPDDYRKTMREAAKRAGVEPEIHFVEVPAGGGSFHHGRTWHGSGANPLSVPRRSLVLHAMPDEVSYVPAKFAEGIGPIYSRYKRLGDQSLDENFFPILWSRDGYRTPEIETFLNAQFIPGSDPE